MRHVFYGEYELTVDDKNRLLIPSEVRKRIDPAEDGEAFFLVVGVNRVPWLYAEHYYEELVSRRPADLMPPEYVLAFEQLSFALASRLEPDKQGRVLIPEKTLKRAGLEKDVTLIGVRDHLELWDRKEWETRRQALEQKIPEIVLLAKQQQTRQRHNERIRIEKPDVMLDAASNGRSGTYQHRPVSRVGRLGRIGLKEVQVNSAVFATIVQVQP